MFIILARRVLQRYGAYDVACALYFWTLVLTLPLLPAENIRFEWKSLFPILYLAVFTTVLGYAFFLHGVQKVSAFSSSIVILIEVIVAFAISFFLLSESFTVTEAIGVALLLAGVLMVAARERAAQPHDGGPAE